MLKPPQVTASDFLATISTHRILRRLDPNPGERMLDAMATSTATAIEILSEMDARIQDRHLLRHPFYQAWTAGTLSWEALRDYSSQYYHHVAAFPTYLSALHSQTDDPTIRRHILNNLVEEEGGSPNHPELWMTFAERLGLTREQVETAELWPETRIFIEGFRKICREAGTPAGLSALYAYESQIPAVSESKIQGLRQFYGFDNPEGYRYFSVHIEADQEHSRVERQLLTRCVAPQNRESCFRAVDEVLKRLWSLLSAVCSRHAICN
jgi:pyrroloquinoline-quinone synthase